MYLHSTNKTHSPWMFYFIGAFYFGINQLPFYHERFLDHPPPPPLSPLEFPSNVECFNIYIKTYAQPDFLNVFFQAFPYYLCNKSGNVIFLVCVFKRAASASSQDMECKAEPAEKIPRTDNHEDDNGDGVTMDDKDAVKKITIKKRKDAVDKKKRYN